MVAKSTDFTSPRKSEIVNEVIELLDDSVDGNAINMCDNRTLGELMNECVCAVYAALCVCA